MWQKYRGDLVVIESLSYQTFCTILRFAMVCDGVFDCSESDGTEVIYDNWSFNLYRLCAFR